MILHTVWPIALILMLWSGLSTYVFIKAPVRYYLKFVLIPFVFGAALAMSQMIYASFGYAHTAALPKEFEFIGHHVVVKGGKKAELEVWVAGQPYSRLYLVPYTKKMEEALTEAQEKRKGGARVKMKGKHKEGMPEEGRVIDEEMDEYESNIVLPHDLVNKEPMT